MLSINFIALLHYNCSMFCVINYFDLIFTNHELSFIKVVYRYKVHITHTLVIVMLIDRK